MNWSESACSSSRFTQSVNKTTSTATTTTIIMMATATTMKRKKDSATHAPENDFCVLRVYIKRKGIKMVLSNIIVYGIDIQSISLCAYSCCEKKYIQKRMEDLWKEMRRTMTSSSSSSNNNRQKRVSKWANAS